MTPPDTSAVRIPGKRNQQLLGVYYLTDTEKPAPLALLLHGIPGAEKNHDLAQHLRADGWHVLVLNFSGAWGSGGDYDIAGQVDDAIAALDFLLEDETPASIDPARVAVVGFSLGSRAALLSAARDARIRAAVSIAGFCDFSDTMLGEDFMNACAPFLSGMTAQSLAAQWLAIGEGLQPLDALEKIAPRHVLILHGTDDEIVPFYHADGFMMKAGQHVRRVDVAGSNHVFGDYRPQLIAAVHAFLASAFNESA
jgi:hypothetical protein